MGMKLDPATLEKVLDACRTPEERAAKQFKDEKAFMAEVVREAKKLRWQVYHTTDSRKSAAGFPDLTLARDRVVFAELKTAAGVESPAQTTWRETLKAAGAEVYLWRPADWAEILKVLA